MTSERWGRSGWLLLCGALIAEIHARQRVPLLVGGTMLYFRALLRGIAAMPAANPESDPAVGELKC